MGRAGSEAVQQVAQPALGHPFRWSRRDEQTLPVTVEGRLPDWLKGQLVRTCPALFEHGAFHAAHWFDAHGLMYGFTFGAQVGFRQQLLASRALAEAERGKQGIATFATDMKRGLFRRLIEPIPPVTDNTNVNVIPFQGNWLAMTETPHQHLIDAATLSTRGLYRYDDALSAGMSMTAHPQYDAARGALVNVGFTFGPTSELCVFRQDVLGHKRVIEGRLSIKRPPYVHSFGLTDRFAVLIDHPLTVNPLKMLFSDRTFYNHFVWQSGRATRLWRLDRQSGVFSCHETDALFCFHVVNTFEQGDDVLFDFLAYDDASIIDVLRTESLRDGLPTLRARLVRARLTPGVREARLEALSDVPFEFPQIHYRVHHGKPYSVCWGAQLKRENGLIGTRIVKVGIGAGQLASHADELLYGEPVFVPRPGASGEDDGVLLTVGTHPDRELSRLCILDARTLEPLASCSIDAWLPLGFHGNFQLHG